MFVYPVGAKKNGKHENACRVEIEELVLFGEVLAGELHVLHQFDGAEVIMVSVADGHILYQHRTAAFVHPHRHAVGFAAAETVDDGAHHRLHFRRVTGEDLAVDGHSRTFEDLRAFVEESIDVVGIDEGNLHRDGVEQGGELL